MNNSPTPKAVLDAQEGAIMSSLSASLKRYRQEKQREWRSPLRIETEDLDAQALLAMFNRVEVSLVALEAERARP